MQVNITGHHIELTDALRDHVQEKLSRLTRHNDQLMKATVTLSVEKNRQQASCTLHAAGAELHSDVTLDDMYAAIDAMADKLDRQVLKLKDRQHHYAHERVTSVASDEAP